MRTGPQVATPPSTLASWYALFGAPVAWFVALCAAYFAVSPACFGGDDMLVHLINALALIVALGAVVTAFRSGRDGKPKSESFLRHGAKLVALIFTLVIIAQWSVVAAFDPCLPLPRRDESPDALILPPDGKRARGAASVMVAHGTRGTP